MLSERQIIILSSIPKVGKKTIFKIGSSINPSKDDYDFKVSLLTWALENNCTPISNETIDKAVDAANVIIEKSEKSHIIPIGYWNANYPENYKKINDPPVLIYLAGNIKVLNEKKKVAIIGTREPSQFGMKAGKRLAEIFTNNGFVVVSGLAKGCDSIAHVGCLESKGKTIAVMAHGLDTVYPKENTDLALEIVKNGGALISEYPVGQKPFGSLFIERDRLQSGLSDATIVIETDIKGGTMHTVKYTEQEKKLLACLKHPAKFLDHPKVNGNIMLIEQGRAAGLESQIDIENFIGKIYEKIGYAPLSNSEEFKPTLFDLNEFTIEETDSNLPSKVKNKAKKRLPKGTVKQAIIWE
ncbi:MAG: DNA-processing protein DprA [Bacteroidia bacterium]